MLAALKRHGYLFLLWTQRDLVSRYAGSVAGLVWAVVHPLATILVFYVVFALILKVRVPELASEAGYFFYLLAGLLPWLSVADGLSRAAGTLIAQEQFLQRIVFPIHILPTAVVVTSLVPQLVGSVVLVGMLAWAGELNPIGLLAWPLVFACQLAITTGLGCALAVLGVHVRDVMQAVPVVLQFLFYATPILYPKTLIPDAYHGWLLFNPVAGLIEAYQSLFLGFPISTTALAGLALWTLLLGGGGWLLFRALKPTLGDYL